MKRSRLTVSILCLLLLCGVADAQLRNQNRIKKWSVKDGLSQGVVNSIVQDDQSIMWLATEDGLNRFDGYAFKIFRSNPKQTELVFQKGYDLLAFQSWKIFRGIRYKRMTSFAEGSESISIPCYPQILFGSLRYVADIIQHE